MSGATLRRPKRVYILRTRVHLCMRFVSVSTEHVCMPMSGIGMHGPLTFTAQAEDGEIISAGNSFFLPQRVYMPQGSLADCLSYPQRQGGQADLGTFVDALRRVGLQKLEREKMDVVHDWSRMLSPGSRKGLWAIWPGWMRLFAAAVAAAAVGGLACLSNLNDRPLQRASALVKVPACRPARGMPGYSCFACLVTVTDCAGEQQRLSFARLLCRGHSDKVFLDEATSALDTTAEARLYAMLSSLCSIYVSVGHRETLVQHHSHILLLDGESSGGTWRIMTRNEYLDQQHLQDGMGQGEAGGKQKHKW